MFVGVSTLHVFIKLPYSAALHVGVPGADVDTITDLLEEHIGVPRSAFYLTTEGQCKILSPGRMLADYDIRDYDIRGLRPRTLPANNPNLP